MIYLIYFLIAVIIVLAIVIWRLCSIIEYKTMLYETVSKWNEYLTKKIKELQK